MEKVLELCARVDSFAVAIYTEYAKKPESGELSGFWRELAEEERTHVAAWQWLAKFSDQKVDDEGLDIGEDDLARMTKLAGEAEEHYGRAKGPLSQREMFTATCDLELGMLDVAFLRLLHLFEAINPDNSKRIDYEAHLRHFADTIRATGIAPELGPVLDRIFEFWLQNKRLVEQARRDYLTGLLNRRGFFGIATPEAALVSRSGGTGGMLMLDLDRFKKVNDTLGHEAGDRVLARLGAIVREHMRKTDVAARFGGEEFMVYLPETDGPGTTAVAEKLRAAVESDALMPVPVTVSVGCAWLHHKGNAAEELERLLKSADKRMYEAKRNGRNRVEAGPED